MRKLAAHFATNINKKVEKICDVVSIAEGTQGCYLGNETIVAHEMGFYSDGYKSSVPMM